MSALRALKSLVKPTTQNPRLLKHESPEIDLVGPTLPALKSLLEHPVVRLPFEHQPSSQHPLPPAVNSVI
ncbi:hypothetical protein M378DRAFT_171110 [Amanita muscaria Koide BX008]|uniref:Uncharacterized protein n=1 Tax=Amanita muscaria (strain Koide BX008) TaxID=946122 RepID=A0A0C2WP31_AMAMK|nr:hypothetical protein M378DRAFT_171110 [Amanita muscaria Koide BX008]